MEKIFVSKDKIFIGSATGFKTGLVQVHFRGPWDNILILWQYLTLPNKFGIPNQTLSGVIFSIKVTFYA